MTTTTKQDKPARRQYRVDGKRVPGVTTVLGVLDKPALVGWAATTAAEATAEACSNGIPPDEAKKIGRAAVFQRRDKAADLGTRAHALVEAHFAGEDILGIDISDDDNAKAFVCARRAIEHIERTCDRVVLSETAYTSPLGFGGTLDLVVERDGKLLIADLKTGKGVHDEVVPQLAAYRFLLSCANVIVDSGLVFHVPVDGEEVTEHEISSWKLDHGWRIFDAALTIYQTRKGAKLIADKVAEDAP
jgi:hypothetical protein